MVYVSGKPLNEGKSACTAISKALPQREGSWYVTDPKVDSQRSNESCCSYPSIQMLNFLSHLPEGEREQMEKKWMQEMTAPACLTWTQEDRTGPFISRCLWSIYIYTCPGQALTPSYSLLLLLEIVPAGGRIFLSFWHSVHLFQAMRLGLFFFFP